MSTTETTQEGPAATIRRAAALIRKRAHAVQHFTSPWRTAGPDEGDEWRDQSDEWRVMYATDHPAAGLIATTPDYGTYCLPDHIASWHPGVALAVADWLASEALEAPGPGEVHLPGGRTSYALAAACAYLGEPSP